MIRVNGQAHDYQQGESLAALLQRQGFNLQRIAVEYNRTIIRQAEWETTIVADGDVIEVVTFVGGG